jgi:hypothetical protein
MTESNEGFAAEGAHVTALARAVSREQTVVPSQFRAGCAGTLISVLSLLFSGFAVIYTVWIHDPVDRGIASINIHGADGKDCIEYSSWVQDRLDAGTPPKTIALMTEMAIRTGSEDQASPPGARNTSYYNPCSIQGLAGARMWVHFVQTGQLPPEIEKSLNATNP